AGNSDDFRRIPANSRRNARRGRFQRRLVDVGNGNFHAHRGETFGGREPYAAGAAGDGRRTAGSECRVVRHISPSQSIAVMERRILTESTRRCVMKMFGAVLGAFLLLGAQSALADDAADCQSADDAASVSACTRLVGSGTLSGHDLAPAYYHRGQALSRGGNPQAAVADFRQALTIDPRFVGGFNDLGLALLQLKNNDAAIAAFDRAIALDPRFAVAYGNRGIARQRKNQNEQAIIDFSRAIGIDPQLTDAYGGRRVSYAYLKDYDPPT